MRFERVVRHLVMGSVYYDIIYFDEFFVDH